MSVIQDKQQDKTPHKHKIGDKYDKSGMTTVEVIFKKKVKTADVYIREETCDPETKEVLSKDDVLMRIVAAVHRATERGESHWKDGRPPLIELFRDNPDLVKMSAYKIRGRTGYSVEHVNKVRTTDAYSDLLARRREDKRAT